MNYYKAIVFYKGTKFSGWQKQIDGFTIQGEFERVVAKISNCSIEDIQVISSGRTDAGVHALNQVVKISTPLQINPENFLKGINSLIHEDIVVKSMEEVSESFQPVFDVKIKEYQYYFSTQAIINPHFQESVVFYKHHLDFEKMKEACKLFEGEHDFVNFHTVGTPYKTTVRHIFSCQIEKVESDFLEFPAQTFVLKICGDGFMKQMVRLIMAAIWQVGSGKRDLLELSEYLKVSKSDKFAPTAPAHGLFLVRVTY